MRRWIYNLISVLFSLIKFSILKIFHWNSFKYPLISRFSPNTDIRFIGNGQIIISKNVTAHTGTKLRVANEGKLFIGENSRFNYGCIIVSRNFINIGKGVGFGPNVLIYDHDHDFRADGGFKSNFKEGKVEIGDNCWIGANTVILKNTILGKNCVVGAGSVITGCFPDNSMIIQKRETTQKNIIISKD